MLNPPPVTFVLDGRTPDSELRRRLRVMDAARDHVKDMLLHSPNMLPSPMQLRRWARGQAQVSEAVRKDIEQSMSSLRSAIVNSYRPNWTIDELRPLSEGFGPWIEYNGGGMPVPDGTLVIRKLRDGTILPPSPAGFSAFQPRDPARPLPKEIVAYRARISQAMTDWFPGTVPPERSGVYELWNGLGERLYARFGANARLRSSQAPQGVWFKACRSVLEAQMTAVESTSALPQWREAKIYQWRGFSAQQE